MLRWVGQFRYAVLHGVHSLLLSWISMNRIKPSAIKLNSINSGMAASVYESRSRVRKTKHAATRSGFRAATSGVEWPGASIVNHDIRLS